MAPSALEDEHANWAPSVNPWTVAVSVMLATFMVVLDSSVANVALPHIAGNLSATVDESTWVLTSYLVSNAIVLPTSGWLASMLGRKWLLMLSIVMFTVASLICGASVSMPMLIVARVLQGAGGGCMQPIAQAILLESFPLEKRGAAMAAYGMGIVVAPIIGPTLGGWITDSYSWRWIFYINLPVGMLALFMVNLFVEDPPYIRMNLKRRVDYAGFLAMALWLGSLQLVLDKGQEDDWFAATWICGATALSLVAMVAFIWRELAIAHPIVELRVFKDRNFSAGTMITAVYGVVLYGMTAMLPLFLQTLMGYPALQSGLAVSPRGLGSFLSMFVAGRLVNLVDNRLLLAFGFIMLAVSAAMLGQLNLEIAMSSVAWPNVLNGFASGFIFVPLTTMAMGTLRKQEMGNATGIYNLMRNIGGSVGIAVVTTLLARGAQVHQSILAGHLSAGNLVLQRDLNALQQGVTSGSTHQAYGLIYAEVVRQSTLLAYMDNFQLLAALALATMPLILIFQRVRKTEGPMPLAE
ncbi:MAG: DHA2 family efflux MFS transporter permease subunit [Bryobacteraceae bacterium]